MGRPDFRASPLLSILLSGSHVLQALSPADSLLLGWVQSDLVNYLKNYQVLSHF